MMRMKRAALSAYICGFTFLLGGLIGCLTGFLCSDAALFHLTERFRDWNPLEVFGACFAAELLLAVIALLFSASVFGSIMIPVLNTTVGYCFGMIVFFSALAFNIAPKQFFIAASLAPGAVILQDIFCTGSRISFLVHDSWTSRGVRSFDFVCRMRRIWIELLLLWILFALQCLFI